MSEPMQRNIRRRGMAKQQLMDVGAPDRAVLAVSARGLDFSKVLKLYEIVQKYAPDLKPMLDEIVSLGADGIQWSDALALFTITARYAPELSGFLGELVGAVSGIWSQKMQSPKTVSFPILSKSDRASHD